MGGKKMLRLKRLLLGEEILSLSKKRKIAWVLGMILLIVCLVCLEIYLDRTLETQSDSDVSSELVLAKILAEEGSILTPNWYYSTELRVVNTNLVFAPLFRIFQDWHTVKLCGIVILHLCLLLSAYLFCRVTKTAAFFPAVGLMLILPFSYEYYYIVLRFPYYVPHLVMTLLIFALAVRFSENQGWSMKSFLPLLLGAALAFGAGLGGARQVAVFLLPFFLAVLIPALQQNAGRTAMCRVLGKRWNRYLLSAFLCLLAGGAGFLLNATVLQQHYHFKAWELSFTEFDAARVYTVLDGFLKSLGYITGKLEGRVLLHNGTAALLLLSSLFAAVMGIRTGKKKSSSYYFFSIFYLVSAAVFILLYAFTDMSYGTWYNLPIVFLGAPLIAMGLKYLDYSRGFKAAALAVWCTLNVLCGAEFLSHRGIAEKKSDHQEIAEFLVSNEYYNGYASFWNANILTELSNGVIDVYCLKDSTMTFQNGDIDQLNTWLQRVSHDTERPRGKVFMLFNQDQKKTDVTPAQAAKDKLWRFSDERIVFQHGGYTVYGYESYSDLVSEIYDYDFVFGNSGWLYQGKDADGIRVLSPSGISYGPYIKFRDGRYRVIVTGSGLVRAEYQCTYDSGANEIPIEMVSKGDQETVFEFAVENKVSNGEVLVKNRSEEPLEIRSLKIDYLGPKDGNTVAPEEQPAGEG